MRSLGRSRSTSSSTLIVLVLMHLAADQDCLRAPNHGDGQRYGGRAQGRAPGRSHWLLSASCSLARLHPLGGILTTIQNGAVSPFLGSGLEFTALAVVVVGGISLLGGRGTILFSIVPGAFIFEMIRNGLTNLGADPYSYRLVGGAVIFAAMYADALKSGRYAMRAEMTNPYRPIRRSIAKPPMRGNRHETLHTTAMPRLFGLGGAARRKRTPSKPLKVGFSLDTKESSLETAWEDFLKSEGEKQGKAAGLDIRMDDQRRQRGPCASGGQYRRPHHPRRRRHHCARVRLWRDRNLDQGRKGGGHSVHHLRSRLHQRKANRPCRRR